MEVWGNFDWTSVRRLEDAGWYVQFYTCPERDYDETWAEQYNTIIVKENGGHLILCDRHTRTSRIGYRTTSFALSEPVRVEQQESGNGRSSSPDHC